MDSHSAQVCRLEVVNAGRRRRWSFEEKFRIVEESYRGHRQVSATARRHDISQSLLFRWRKAFRQGRLGMAPEEPDLVPAIITRDDDPDDDKAFTRKKPSKKPFPEHLPRERVVIPGPTSCDGCGSTKLSKLGEDITETLEVIPRQWKVIQYVREKFTCRPKRIIGREHLTATGSVPCHPA